MPARDLLDAIGKTPLVRLRMPAADGVEVYAKLEMQNLFGIKDRVGKHCILEARRRGELAPGGLVVESSSGTMALGVALAGRLLGHPVHIVTDPRIDRVTLAKLHALGCGVDVVTEMDERGWQGARLRRLASVMEAHPGAFCPRQYENPDNPAAYAPLARELLAELGSFDVLVSAVGSGGCVCGTARALHEKLPQLYTVGVDAVGSVLFGQPDRPGRLQSGLGNSLHPPNLDVSLIDEVHWLSDHEALAATRRLALDEKLFCGNTSGSVYQVMGAIAARSDPGTRIVGILADRGDRYVDTIYDDGYWERHGLDGEPAAEQPRRVLRDTPVSSWSFAVLSDRKPAPAFVFIESNTTGTGMLGLRSARTLGFQPVLVTRRPGLYDGLAGTGALIVECETNDVTALGDVMSAAAEELDIAGVTSTSEFYLESTARIAERLGLPGERPAAVATCRDKSALRQVLAETGVRQPRFAVATTPEQALRQVAGIGLPCVVKPVDDSGSSGVRQCLTPDDVARQAGAVLSRATNGREQPAAGKVLLEEYLPGPEYSVEMFGEEGKHRLLAVVEKALCGSPYFVERQHILPADLPAGVAEDIVPTVVRALHAAGLTRGPTHTEVRLTAAGAAVLEVNPRLAGGMIPELYRLVTGVDLLECQIRLATGMELALPEHLEGYAGIRFLLAPQAGMLAGVAGLEAARSVGGVESVTITARRGDRVRPARDAYGRIGHVIARGPSRSSVVEALERACESLSITVREDLSDVVPATGGSADVPQRVGE